jgi:hypothetical protein
VARKARRDRERQATQRNAPPTRYKRRRPQAPASAVGVVEPELDDDDVDELGEHEHEHESGVRVEHLDPLDAQNAGQHERDFDLGHEEIHLNLEAVDAPHYVAPPPAPSVVDTSKADDVR